MDEKSADIEKNIDLSSSQISEEGSTEIDPAKSDDEIIAHESHQEIQAISADRSVFQNGQLEVVSDSDQTKIFFQLRPQIVTPLLEFCSKQVTDQDNNFQEVNIMFREKLDKSMQSMLAGLLYKGYQIEKNSTKILISRNVDSPSLLGYMVVDMPRQEGSQNSDILLKIKNLFVDQFQMDIFDQISPESIQQNKEDILRQWIRTPSNQELTENQKSYVNKISEEEIVPGYIAPVIPGIDEEFKKKFGKFLFYHELPDDNPEVIIDILNNGGLLSTKERYNRNITSLGRSSREDFRTGGADMVFTYLRTPISELQIDHTDYTVIISPVESRRLDVITYENDEHGAVDNETLERAIPFIRAIKKYATNPSYASGDNGQWRGEVLFRTGISTDTFLAIKCKNEEARTKILTVLIEAGITKINSKPIDQFISVEDEFQILEKN